MLTASSISLMLYLFKFLSFLLQANELLQHSRQVQNKIEKERMLRESLKEYQKISNQVDLPNVCAQYRQGEKRTALPTLPGDRSCLPSSRWPKDGRKFVSCVSVCGGCTGP